jgi:predicted small secreted protein
MKKLLLVLLVVTLASFLLVGCLPGTTPAEGEGEGEGEVEVTMTIDKEYTNASGVTFVACAKDVTVTFPTPVAVDYVVYIARKIVEGDGTVTYKLMPDTEPIPATPNADRTVWTVEEYEFLYGYPCDGFKAKQPNGFECECEPICLVALVKHPCCPGEEVALRVVTVDCTPPKLDLFVKFTDCEDVCVEPDPCDPPVPGAYMEWTNKTSYACDTLVDCCEDDCSGEGPWSLVADPDPCLGPCDTAAEEGCPVEGVIECGCFDYAPDTSENVCYYVDFSFEDNVGNARESTWKLCFDTDSLVSFEVDDNPGEVFSVDRTLSAYEGRYAVYNDCE